MAEKERIRYRAQLFVCSGKSCSEKSDPQAVKKFFKDKIKEAGLKDELRVCTCSCLDYCDDAPNMVLYPDGILLKEEQDLEKVFALLKK
jgi:NADH:ubiquinone oxidoreductase subunit E